jgi:hypothetical protein
MIEILMCAVAGYKLGERYLCTSTEKPAWQTTVSGAEIVLTHQVWRAKPFYRVYIAANGATPMVWSGQQYVEAVSTVQAWHTWLSEGGTVEGWYLANEKRRQEVAMLNAAL